MTTNKQPYKYRVEITRTDGVNVYPLFMSHHNGLNEAFDDAQRMLSAYMSQTGQELGPATAHVIQLDR